MARGYTYATGASEEVMLARRPDVERSRLVDFATSKNAAVRAAVAGRDDCPLGLMVTLAHDGTPDVRAAVAANPITHGTVMEFLATDRSVAVLLALATNPSLSRDIASELAGHKKADVRDAAARRLASGVGPHGDAGREDLHNPELAEHVEPLPMAAKDAISLHPTAAKSPPAQPQSPPAQPQSAVVVPQSPPAQPQSAVVVPQSPPAQPQSAFEVWHVSAPSVSEIPAPMPDLGDWARTPAAAIRGRGRQGSL